MRLRRESEVSSLIIVLIITVNRFLPVHGLLFAPVISALSAHVDQVHPVLGRVHEGHSLGVITLAAVHVFTPSESRVLDALLVNVEEELWGLTGASCLARGARRCLELT